ncbi:MAG TPA: ribosome silencing factor [Alphaproteobacteria bacterium]|nr:ribosome silencing factor [Alphaproteobacteria bacterium]HNS45377.1 ribosome silencing factor [Alphaproteobacteria bacterium]
MGNHIKAGENTPHTLKDAILHVLDENKAEEIESIDLNGQSSLADYMIVASGTSSRQVAALAGKLEEKLPQYGFQVLRTEGLPTADWVVVDCGDAIVHLFRPEVRDFYNIEKMWRQDIAPVPSRPRAHHAH